MNGLRAGWWAGDLEFNCQWQEDRFSCYPLRLGWLLSPPSFLSNRYGASFHRDSEKYMTLATDSSLFKNMPSYSHASPCVFRAFCSMIQWDKFICYICEECVRLIQVWRFLIQKPNIGIMYLSERTLLCLLHYNWRNDAFRTDIIHLRIVFIVKTSCIGMIFVVKNMDDVKYGKCCVWQLNEKLKGEMRSLLWTNFYKLCLIVWN
jgi:hypothetical protein